MCVICKKYKNDFIVKCTCDFPVLPNVVESGEPSVAGDICELAAVCLTKFPILGLNVQ